MVEPSGTSSAIQLLFATAVLPAVTPAVHVKDCDKDYQSNLFKFILEMLGIKRKNKERRKISSLRTGSCNTNEPCIANGMNIFPFFPRDALKELLSNSEKTKHGQML